MPKYKADGKKQVAGSLPDKAYDKMSTVTPFKLSKSPSYIIATTAVSNLGLWLDSSASFAAKASAEGGSLLYSGSSGYSEFTFVAGQQLNLHPLALSGSAADVAKIKFIYKSGLATGGF